MLNKNLQFKVKLSLCNYGEHKGEITFASCACPAGKGSPGNCKHIVTLCYALEEFVRLMCTRDFETCASKLQTWNQPRKRKFDSQSVYEIDFLKKIYRREQRNNVKPLNDPRRPSEGNNDSKKIHRKLLEKIKRVKRKWVSFVYCQIRNLTKIKMKLFLQLKSTLSH